MHQSPMKFMFCSVQNSCVCFLPHFDGASAGHVLERSLSSVCRVRACVVSVSGSGPVMLDDKPALSTASANAYREPSVVANN